MTRKNCCFSVGPKQKKNGFYYLIFFLLQDGIEKEKKKAEEKVLKYFGWWTTSITGRPEKGWDEAGNIRWTRPFSTSWGGVEKITLTWFKTFLGGEEEMHRYEPTTFDPPLSAALNHVTTLFFCFFLFLYPVRLGLFCYFTSTGRLTSFVTFLSISRRPLFFSFYTSDTTQTDDLAPTHKQKEKHS